MYEQRYLHEGERLLCVQRSTPAVLLRSIGIGFFEGLTLGVALGIVIAIASLLLGASVPWIVIAVIAVLCVVGVMAQRARVCRSALFRVTTERILIAEPMHLFHAKLHTVKWSQYQESEAGRRQFLDLLFLARPLRIRYGTADARTELRYPSLSYAEDLKHYLDKVDSLLRAGKGSEIKEFIAKPRGRRG
jgi:uncharacterized membrane protein (Fun14 family)